MSPSSLHVPFEDSGKYKFRFVFHNCINGNEELNLVISVSSKIRSQIPMNSTITKGHFKINVELDSKIISLLMIGLTFKSDLINYL